ncbi:hypothetical protein Taro_035926 [Colocasia esculenta]|uniref:Uncharacterized protein n=1 Tax=Colocasia esculenta TaxID=4460 RepID=A0A843WK43_COLES|nr:hypothetical protein [Colocasia esculenta]
MAPPNVFLWLWGALSYLNHNPGCYVKNLHKTRWQSRIRVLDRSRTQPTPIQVGSDRRIRLIPWESGRSSIGQVNKMESRWIVRNWTGSARSRSISSDSARSIPIPPYIVGGSTSTPPNRIATRSETIESILCGSLFPPEFSTKDKVKHWITAFSKFDKVEVKALEQVLAQKQRIQQEMQKYLSVRQTYQDSDAPELYKRISGSFKTMSRLFTDPAKTEESFQILNQLKDANIWKILTYLLEPCTSFDQAWTYRGDLLRILGEKHPLYDFMETLSMRCSYLLFNKEYVKVMLSDAVAEQSADDPKFVSSCMNLLAILASFCPSLLAGFEEDLVRLLKEDNDVIKEGIAHILAKAGGAIREQLTKASSSVDLFLEGLCLEGTRGQAKYSVQALAAITKDDGLKSLSVLYKRLVDMLEKRTHLPAILQSLGYIAQTAMPVFETREGEIIEFVTQKILACSSETASHAKTDDWNEISELCLLKIFGIKTLVRSYLPIKDAHLRLGIENLLEILKNILSFGEISDVITSSTVDKAHLRLASAKSILRLSRQWESKIPADIYFLTLRTAQDIYPQCRKLFLNKVHLYIKERLLDPKYACAFLFDIGKSELPICREDQQNLVEIIQVCTQMKARQLSVQNDLNSLMSYPEYILAYLVHALAHHSGFPNINNYEDIEAFEKIYCSEDVVDREKSKNSHAICDIGLSLVKRLGHDQIDIASMTKSVPLPEQLYKTLEKDEGNSVPQVDTTVSKDDMVPRGSDEEGSELPLGKIMKTLKSQGAKKKKMVKKQAMQSGVEKLDNDIDVLGMVREINLVAQGRDERLVSQKKGKNNDDGSAPASVPKKKRSPFLPKIQSRSAKGQRRMNKILKHSSESDEDAIHSGLKFSREEYKVESADSELLTSCSPATKTSSLVKKHILQRSNGTHPKRATNSDLQKSTKLLESEKADAYKSTSWSIRKQKRSFTGLEKCSSEKSKTDDSELVGCRIKIWWPLDKQFYEGTVQSYDTRKKKHVILYDDGDVEVLHLNKEKWELLNSNFTAKKVPSLLCPSCSRPQEDSKNISPEDISKQKKNSSKKKRTAPRKRRDKQPRASESKISADSSDIDDSNNSQLSNAHHRSGSEVDDGNSGQEQHSEAEDETTPIEAAHEFGGEKLDSSGTDDNEDSENEPLSAWKQRAVK